MQITRQADYALRAVLHLARHTGNQRATAKEIAERLGISLTTARGHIQKILKKLGVHSKLEAVAMVLRQKQS